MYVFTHIYANKIVYMLIYTTKFDVSLFLVKTNLMNKCQTISII